MEKVTAERAEIRLVGMTARTNNAAEMNPTTGKIGPMVHHYFSGAAAEKISQRKKPHVTYCAYTNYASDASGEYTFFIGEEVTDFSKVPEGFATLTIPAQKYIKFTTQKGPMPAVCINAWQEIWQMSEKDLGGTRAFQADFEVYDERSYDQQNTVLDIYIGIK